MAAVVGAKRDEVIFTSGATEANNLAILGLREAARDTSRMHVITSTIEHKAVLELLTRWSVKAFGHPPASYCSRVR